MEADFLKTSLLDTIIPDDTTTSLPDLLERYADVPEDSNRLLAVQERNILFFGTLHIKPCIGLRLYSPLSDERVRTLAVLQLPHCDEEALESYLSQLSFKIDVWAIDESSSNEQTAPATIVPSPAPPSKDLVFSYEAVQKDEPFVLASQSTNSQRTLTLVWEIYIVLSRPRFRVYQPSILFKPSATITAPPQDASAGNEDLAPYQPLESNILEPMRFIPGLAKNPPYLAASRLERVMPIAATHRPRIHISHVPPRKHRAVPATIARIRYNRVNTFHPSFVNLASLDMEIIPFVQITASVESVDLSLRSGRTESLMPGFLPVQCRSGDCVVFLHKLHQEADAKRLTTTRLVNPNIDVLSIKIRLQIELSAHCKPLIAMDWTTNIDFTQALNPTYGPPSQPIQRANRPTSLPVLNGDDGSLAGTTLNTSLQPTSDVNSRGGLSISFTAPDKVARVGVPFVWKVLVMNHSLNVAKITIIPLPRIQRQTTQAQFLAKRHAPRSSTASFHPSERRHTKSQEEVDIAQAVVDENVVYAMHHSNVVPPATDLMALTAELRIGPLGPGQCHESEIEMVAFETGALRVDAMRIVDLVKEAEEGATAPGVVVDIKDLPDIAVINGADGEIIAHDTTT